MTKWTDNEERLGFMFDEAMSLREQGKLLESLQKLSELSALLGPSDQRLVLHTELQLGHIHQKLGDMLDEPHFRRASSVAPDSELASLCLFHSLTARDQWQDAMQEMVRFVGLRNSTGYRELLAEGFGSDMSEPLLALATEARRLLARYN